MHNMFIQSQHSTFLGWTLFSHTVLVFMVSEPESGRRCISGFFFKYILFEPKLRVFTVSCCETNYKESMCIQFCFFKHANSSLVIIMVQWIGTGVRREFSYWFLWGRNFTTELLLFWLGWKLCKTMTVIILISAASAMFKPGIQVP